MSLGTSNLVFTWLLIPVFSYKARMLECLLSKWKLDEFQQSI